MSYQYGAMKFASAPKAPTLDKFFSWFDDFINNKQNIINDNTESRIFGNLS